MYLLFIIKSLILILFLLIAVAYFTLAKKKLLAVIQRRKGSDLIGVFWILQPLSDGLKLLVKKTILPSNANTIIFLAAPILTFLISLLCWAVIVFNKNLVLSDLGLGLVYILSLSSLGVYGIILSG